MTQAESVQERYASRSICFGCGPANSKGLRVRSRVEGQDLVAEWTPQAQYEAYAGALNGGVIGTLLDCHSNWTAALHLMRKGGRDAPPCTVTADFHVRLVRPTPSNGPVFLRARVVEANDDRATVEATLEAGGRLTASCRGTFVAVKEGHPAFHRW